MSTTMNTAAAVNKAESEHIAAQLARTHELTRSAAIKLGIAGSDAVKAANDGGLLLDGCLVTVTPIPSSVSSGVDDGRLVISASTGRRLEDLGRQATASLLAQAPGLLASFGTVAGCSPDGVIMLHRIWQESDAASPLAKEMLVIRHLAQLVADQTETKGGQWS